MQQDFVPLDQTTISLRQKRLMGIFSGLLLGVLEAAFYFNAIHFHSYPFWVNGSPFWVNSITMTGIIALFYVLAPIPLSFYITRQTGDAREGWKAGSMTGCIGAIVLPIFIFGFYIWLVLNGPGDNWTVTGRFLLIIPLWHGAGALIGLLGATIGSLLGKIGKRSVS